MCYVCRQWSGRVYPVWSEACSELARLQALTARLPSPYRENQTAILHKWIQWDPNKVDGALAAVAAHPPGTDPNELNAEWSKLTSNGEFYRDKLRECADATQQALDNMAVLFGGGAPSPWMSGPSQIMDAFSQMNARTEQTLQKIHDTNMEIGQGWIDALSGNPIVYHRWRR